ncbi:MAG: right-handed parallel beta-helix repeat-containing protein [Oscillospiraceae bacterium]|jgi:hypothetical protein|nr:right-handed parallel beta-helix repeat-containing protein [Oscillospiraceae bacterium]
MKRLKQITSLALALIMLAAFIPAATAAYTEPELARAVALGFGAYRADNLAVTYAQFMKMLDRTVELADSSKLAAWQRQFPEARAATREMTRFEGMMLVLEATITLGGDYAEFNSEWWIINNTIGEKCWDEIGRISNPYQYLQDYELVGKKIGFEKSSFVYDWSSTALAYFYSFGRVSLYSGKTIFEYDAAKNSVRPDEPFLHTEALLAALRLHDSGLEISARFLTDDDIAILNAAEERKQSILDSPTEITITGTSYYVSNDGNDSNDGRSSDKSWRTLDKVNNADLKPGDGVFFKRGDLWRGSPLMCQEGVTYSAYGEGEKPRIYGSQENSAGAEKWSLLEGTDNIWVYYKEMTFCGYFAFNEGERFAQKRYAYWDGKRYNVVDDKRISTGAAFDVKMLENYEFFNDVDLTGYDTVINGILPLFDCLRTGKLYLRCDDGNPGEIYESIEIASLDGYVGLVQTSKDVVIDNLAIKYYGNCGLTVNDDGLTIQNNEISFCGGADWGLFIELSQVSGAGGGVVFSKGSNGIIRNNYIHEVYDEGVTIEFGWEGLSVERLSENMLIEGNIFERTGFAFQIAAFTVQQKGIVYRNIVVNDNYMLYIGYPRGSVNRGIEISSANAIIFADDGERNMDNIIVSNNVFYISRKALVRLHTEEPADIIFSGNTYVQNNFGPVLSDYYSSSSTQNIFYNEATLSDIIKYLGDKTAKVLPLSFAPANPLDTAADWAKAGITAAIGKGFVPADIQGSYTNVITRAEFCRLAVRWLEVRLDKNIDAIVAERGIAERMGHTFSDTTDPNILAAYRLGVTGGELAPTDAAPGRFNPGGQFNREQAAMMILNTVKVAGMDVSNTSSAGFNDIGTASGWAVNAINYVRNAGIMSGTGTADNPLFSPQRAYTRQESIVTFNNIG